MSEVLNIKGGDIEETSTSGTKLNTDYILGMAKMEGEVKILLDQCCFGKISLTDC